ncbi:hypothetical protein [Streptomyces otsuchiensis]|nr:hypothetical protein [Streptomyces otsuchiensis]
MTDRIAAGVTQLTEKERAELARKNAEVNRRSEQDAQLRGGRR